MYQVLYRKWRPRNFSDVVGQRAIIATLKNEIATGKISHAYLFTGSRGTGKTTCAKIFAKAVNCLCSKDGEPCNECEICRGIDDGTVLDVEEIDAASNNGVDNIREIRDEVNFTPAKAKYRVYIIDEVHMLSPGAFNALLKTLEEPPAHVIFILATTEVHKLPATILSRCQRFDFGRISSEDIAGRLKAVAKNECIELDDEAALLIAGLADGGMRDALSLLDRCNTGAAVTAKMAGEILGLASKESLFAISSALSDRNLALCLEIIKQMNDSSSDISRVAEQLVGHFRNIMIAKAVKKPGELIVCQKEELVRYMNAGEGFSMARILEILDAFQQTAEKMKKAASKRVELEMAFVSLCVNEQSKAVGEVPVQNGDPGGAHSFQSTSAIGAQNFRNAAQNGFSEGTQIGHNLQNTDQSGASFADGSVTAAERKTADAGNGTAGGSLSDSEKDSVGGNDTANGKAPADGRFSVSDKASVAEKIAALKKAAFADRTGHNPFDIPTDKTTGSFSDKLSSQGNSSVEEKSKTQYMPGNEENLKEKYEPQPDRLPWSESDQSSIELAERAAEKYRGSAEDDPPPWDEETADFLPYEERMEQAAENNGRPDGQAEQQSSVQSERSGIGADEGQRNEIGNSDDMAAERETADIAADNAAPTDDAAPTDSETAVNTTGDDMSVENPFAVSESPDNEMVNTAADNDNTPVDNAPADNTPIDNNPTDNVPIVGNFAGNASASNTVFAPQRVGQSTQAESGVAAAERENSLKDDRQPEKFGKWPEVLEALSEINRMLSSTLKESSAYIKGDSLLLIKSENPMFFELIRKESKNKSDIRAALMKITGKQFRLGPYEQGTVKPKADPMMVFLEDMKQKGINIVEKQ